MLGISLVHGEDGTGGDSAVVLGGVESADRLALGRRVYNYRCYFCHGYSGDAQTLAARLLDPPPRDFTRADLVSLDRDAMVSAVTDGRPGSAMKPFAGVLSSRDIEAVVDYVRSSFMDGEDANTRYHTAENGWPGHERFRVAFPFATGAIPLDAPPEDLTAAQREGLRLYQRSCVSCHDRSHVEDTELRWEPEALSYPRRGFQPGDSLRSPDALSGATTFARHDVMPVLPGLSDQERRGQGLYQANCAFCHGADGTGRNWIGSFLNPHPRDLTDPDFMGGMTVERLDRAIRRGLPGTSMPAWEAALNDQEIADLIAYLHRAFHPLSGAVD